MGAPIDDMMFVLRELADLQGVSQLPGVQRVSTETVRQVLEEAGKFADGILAPLNASGDVQGCALTDDGVATPDGMREAYARYRDASWNGLPFDEAWGGQGLPWAVSMAVSEIWHGANVAFGLCPLLTQSGAVLLGKRGDDALKRRFLSKLVGGAWTATMCMTEPGAGSDLSAIGATAEPDGDVYRLKGQKIFISYGDHDLADNIVHFVLARTPGAADGVKGLSLFLVPKVTVDGDGNLGAPNDVQCVSMERKLGFHAAPTCTMAFGETTGAEAHLIGAVGDGLPAMFAMMNHARLAVGVQGVAMTEQAYRQARDYARERVQGHPVGDKTAPAVAIAEHADVKRMVLETKAQAEASRALVLFVASSLDKADRHTDPAVRRYNQAVVDLLTPVVKAWATDGAVDAAGTAIQVMGGMGYMEDTGAPQRLREARLLTLYEGANGIQALDLVGRKVAREKGLTVHSLISQMRGLDKDMAGRDHPAIAAIRAQLTAGVDSLEVASAWLLRTWADTPDTAAAGAGHYLKLLGIVTAGWLMARAALAADDGRDLGAGAEAFAERKLATARFFAEQVVLQADFLASAFMRGGSAASGVDSTLL